MAIGSHLFGGFGVPASDFARYLQNRGSSTPTTGTVAGGVAPPAGGGVTAPKVDYSALINAELQPLLAGLSAQGISDEAGAKSAFQRGVIQTGLHDLDIAGLSKSLGVDARKLASWYDATTRSLAEKNTLEGLSTSARATKANSDAERAIKNALAARGMSKSGEASHLLGEEALRFKQSRHDLSNQFGEYVSGIFGQLAQAERLRKEQELQARINALTAMLNQPPPAAAPAAPAPAPVTNTAKATNYAAGGVTKKKFASALKNWSR